MNKTSEVDRYLIPYPKEIRVICEHLRYLILNSNPQVVECIKWGLPFYVYKGNLCFLNPKNTHVEMGLYRGASLSNDQGVLVAEDRKQIRHIVVQLGGKIPERKVIEVLQEAAIFNEGLHKK